MIWWKPCADDDHGHRLQRPLRCLAADPAFEKGTVMWPACCAPARRFPAVPANPNPDADRQFVQIKIMQSLRGTASIQIPVAGRRLETHQPRACPRLAGDCVKFRWREENRGPASAIFSQTPRDAKPARTTSCLDSFNADPHSFLTRIHPATIKIIIADIIANK